MGPDGASLLSIDRFPVLLYLALWTVFALLGVRRLWLVWLYRRGHRAPAPPTSEIGDFPLVTVQLPIYNERYVVRRLLRAVAALEWPRGRLEIQVLDDSTDDTAEIAAEEVARLRRTGIDVVHLHRPVRDGYKAGALAWGLERARGDLLLIFDADFVPEPDLLRRIAPRFRNPRVGMVQVRWEHLNADHSLLARVQAIALDGHFVVEHEARSRHGLFFNFNGTAGMWRRACIESAGGWQHDTLTEDLDLSYRAQLLGWKFEYLTDVTCPSELPVDMRSFKSQQFRWMKGSAQVAKKILPLVWRSKLSAARKLELAVHLTQNLSFPLVLLLSLCAYPTALVNTGWISSPWLQLPLIGLATGSVLLFYAAALAGARSDWKRWLRYLPALMCVAVGLSVSNTLAVLEGLAGRPSPFVRTPKLDLAHPGAPAAGTYHAGPSWTSVGELALAAYFVLALALVLAKGILWGVPFLAVFLFGYLYVGLLSAGLPLPRRASSG
jgi:cellulose synthase/poly-beta-1,6-N-acetylglucosamine synthase-like glycosyltransferase